MPSPVFSIKIDFNGQPLDRNLVTLSPKVDGQIHAVVAYQAEKAQSHMKTTAPWTDRTGNARAGLTAKPGWVPGQSHSIELFHRVKYGIFLEVRWAGRFAVIRPTLERLGPDTMRMLNGLFSRIGGGMP